MAARYSGGVIDIGRTWVFVVQNWRDSTGAYFSLIGWTAKFALNDEPSLATPVLTATTAEVVSDGLITLTTIGSPVPTANKITIAFSAAKTLLLLPRNYNYELVLIQPDTVQVSLLKGIIPASPGVV